MNKQDRETISALRAKLEELKSAVESIGSELREIADAEQEKFDNMPEGLQQGDAGQAIESAAGTLDEIASAAEDGNLAEAIDLFEQLEV